MGSELASHGVSSMITLSPDEAALIKSLLIALRGIKTKDLDKALAILSGRTRQTQENNNACVK
jgi:hypothetical protein